MAGFKNQTPSSSILKNDYTRKTDNDFAKISREHIRSKWKTVIGLICSWVSFHISQSKIGPEIVGAQWGAERPNYKSVKAQRDMNAELSFTG